MPISPDLGRLHAALIALTHSIRTLQGLMQSPAAAVSQVGNPAHVAFLGAQSEHARALEPLAGELSEVSAAAVVCGEAGACWNLALARLASKLVACLVGEIGDKGFIPENLPRIKRALAWIGPADLAQAAGEAESEILRADRRRQARAEALTEAESPKAEATGEVPAGKPSASKPVAESPCVKLYGENDAPDVNGKQKQPLSKPRYDLVLALIKAGKNGLTKDRLVKESGHSDPVKTMKRLANSDPDWKAVLIFPGGNRQGGYRIR